MLHTSNAVRTFFYCSNFKYSLLEHHDEVHSGEIYSNLHALLNVHLISLLSNARMNGHDLFHRSWL